MKDSLSTLFKGQAHFKVLELLSRRKEPARLRTLAELSGMYVRSIELALAYLIKRNVVTRAKKKALTLYSLNFHHPQASLLRKIFNLIAEDKIQRSSSELDQKAKGLLSFSDSAIKLFYQAKR